MLLSIYMSTAILISLTSARAVSQPDVAQLSKRAEAPDNIDLWTLDGDELKPNGDIKSQGSPDGTPAPFDVTFTSDGHCDFSKYHSHTDSVANYRSTFCTQRTAIVHGDPVKISPDIDCAGLQSCSETHTNSVTVSSAKQITSSVNFNADLFQTIKSTASLGGSKTWTDTTSSTDSHTFTPKPGSKGHMVFFPYMYKTCGQLFTIKGSFSPREPPFSYYVMDTVDCGFTPVTLPSGAPDGVSLNHDDCANLMLTQVFRSSLSVTPTLM